MKKKTTKKAVQTRSKKATVNKKSAKKAAARPKTTTKRKSTKVISGFQRFELVDGKSSKFWEISQNGSEFTVRYGRIGTDGQSKTKAMGSSEKAAAEVEKLIRAKVTKGYMDFSGDKKAPATGRKSSAAKSSKKKTTKNKSAKEVSSKKKGISTRKTALKKRGEKVLTKENAEQELATEHPDFSSYTRIRDDAAKLIGEFKGSYLNLEKLRELSAEGVQRLCNFKGELVFGYLENISAVMAETLSKRLLLTKEIVQKMCDEDDWEPRGEWGPDEPYSASQSLADFTGITDDALELILSEEGMNSEGFDGGGELYECLNLFGIQFLTDVSAGIIESEYKGLEVRLQKLLWLSDNAAESLSRHKGGLEINLNNLPKSAAAILRKHPSLADED